jgi:capsular exopolysaccharide synthesis family protein
VTDYKKVLVGPDTPFAIGEAFKEIRTNMLYTARDVRCPVYAITSAFAHEGKSVLLANLAAAFAGLGKRVLLIDADLRNPAQHKVFSLDRSVGLSEVIAGICEDASSAVLATSVEGLDVIPSGHIPPNPTELLSGARFETIIAAMQEKYDAIFIDFPPAGVVVDAMIPARIITGYVVAVRSALADRRAVADVLSALRSVGANILGFVMNDVDLKHGGYGRGKRGKYGYRYRYNYSYTHPTTEKPEEK